MKRREFLKTSILGMAAIGSGASLQSCVNAKTKNSFDTIIKNGVIYDGSGRPAIMGDLAIKDGKIAAIGSELGNSANSIIDAGGHAITPGFIDIHSHTDTNLFKAPKGNSRIFQGVTSEVGGNCGEGPFLANNSYKDADSFLTALQESGIGINYSTLVGHGDVRNAIVGPYNVPATDEQITQMCDLLDRQLDMGAVGLSFGLEYAPGCYADKREMIALCKIVKKHDALYTIHMRNEDDHVVEALDEAIEVARLSGARLEVSHLKAQNPANFDKLDILLAKIDAARSAGVDITFDRYPYTAFSTGFTSFIPVELRDGTDEDIMNRLHDPVACAQIRKYAEGRIARFGGAEKVTVAGCVNPDNQMFAGKDLAECCRLSGKDPWEMIRHLLISEKLKVQQATFAMKEENLRMIYAHPLSMPASDGSVYSPDGELGRAIPHPRSYGTFARFFETFVRDEKILDMATAVWKCTGLPASRTHMKNRGLLMPGYAADVVVFDAASIADVATYANPHTYAKGIDHVFVNGTHTIKYGEHTGALAGEVLRVNI